MGDSAAGTGNARFGHTPGMIVTRHGHACLLIESPSTRVLVDPGIFTNSWRELTDLDAILITHQHPDHADVDNLPGLVAANPQARLVTETAVADPSAIEEEILHFRRAALAGGIGDKSAKARRPLLNVHLIQVIPHVHAEKQADALA